jgi:predicted dehydrogenase
MPVSDDKVSVTLEFADGSLATIHYLANGDKSFPKERIEVFAAGRVLQLDNFRNLRGWGWQGFKKMNLWRQDKGQLACVAAFLASTNEGGSPAIQSDEIFEVSRWTIEAAQTARTRV